MIKTVKILSSLKLALFLLISIMILVTMGTLFQSQTDISDVQKKFFRSFFIFVNFSSLKIPIFPGGYLLSGLLLINLVSSLLLSIYLTEHGIHQFWSKLGIYLIHIGIILLLIGESLGGIFSSESLLSLNIGEKKNYSVEDDEKSFRYFPFWIELSEFKHEKHPGTDIPKSFSSLVAIYSNEGKIIRRAFISMNNPLKYQGYSFYQAGFGNDDRQSILKVVKNPASGSPYLFSFIVIIGFIYQFIYRFSHAEKTLKNRLLPALKQPLNSNPPASLNL